MLGNYLQQTTSADDIFRCIFFLGALRVNQVILHHDKVMKCIQPYHEPSWTYDHNIWKFLATLSAIILVTADSGHGWYRIESAETKSFISLISTMKGKP